MTTIYHHNRLWAPVLIMLLSWSSLITATSAYKNSDVSQGQLQNLKFTKSVSYDSTAQGGTINKSKNNNTILTFKVETTDDSKNETFTCLNVQFSLKVDLSNVTTTSLDPATNKTISKTENFNLTMTEKTTLSEKYSTCDTLFLNFEGPGEDDVVDDGQMSSLKLKFSIEQSEKDDADVEIFYLQNLQAEKLSFAGHPGAVTIPFVKEGSPLPDDAPKYDSTPIEANLKQSFKCYFGFQKSSKNIARPEDLSPSPKSPQLNIPDSDLSDQMLTFSISKFRMQMFKAYQQDTSIWLPTLSCDNDVSKILPTIVGVILASIVVLTIAGYIVARKRSRHAYEEL